MKPSSMLAPHQAHLLGLCTIEHINWHLLAREAQRPDGLSRLLEGRLIERSTEASEARRVLRAHLSRLPDLTKNARQRAEPAFSMGARLTTVLDKDYPLNLRSIFNLPPFLFYRGRLQVRDIRAVAVVGTREPTPEGLRRAHRLATMLAKKDVTVLSGLAKGIDTAAHEAALQHGARTVAVMGTGICRIYPPENEELASQIVKRGALVSQFWPETPPTSYTFPRRNITMSGMSQGTAVIEASSTSGAKMQARLALEHGKPVFLLRSLVAQYPWARKYLDRGAIQVKDVETIIRRLQSPVAVRQRVEEQAQLSLAFS